MKYFAETKWTISDVQSLKPNWSDDKCRQWLSENAKYIQEAAVSAGWVAMESLLEEV